jgi:hypothetical protein
MVSQECFEKELSEAKSVIQEPPQPKIRLKMTPGQETPVIGPKKITIHVGGSRSSTAASPAPQVGQSSDLGRPDGAVDGNRSIPPLANTTSASFQVDHARIVPGVIPSPRPSVVGPMPGVGAQQSPVVFPRANGNVPSVMNTPNGMVGTPQNLQQPPPIHQLQNGHPAPAPLAAPPIYDYKYRAPGRGGLISFLAIGPSQVRASY